MGTFYETSGCSYAKESVVPGNAIKKSMIFPLVGAVALPVLILIFLPEAIGLVWWCFFMAAFLSIPIFIFGFVYTWMHSDEGFLRVLGKFVSPVPPGMIYGSDLKTLGFPIATLGLITANTILYFITPDEIVNQLCFLPYSDLNLAHVMLTTVTCAFFHADFGHLFGNMVFLWAFGAALEPRLGSARYLIAYLLCSVISSLICLNLLVVQVIVFDDPLLILRYSSLGASGVISGLTGLFVVRCYFARLSFSLPFWTSPLFSVPVRVNSIVLIGMFFATDLAGSVEQLTDAGVMIDYWGHVGGFLGGVALGLVFKLQDDGYREAREVKAERFAKAEGGTAEASEIYKEVLERDPQNLNALRHFLKLNCYNSEQEGEYFSKLISANFHKDLPGVLRLVQEYYPRHLNLLNGDLLFHIGVKLYQQADLEKARLCLELAAEKTGSWQNKAMLHLSRTFEAIGNDDRALSVLQKLLAWQPEDIFRRQAEKRMLELKSRVSI